MNLSIYPLGLLLAIILSSVGIIYRRKKHLKLGVTDLSVLIVFSYITGTGIIYFLKGIDYAVFKWWGIGPILGNASNEVLEVLVIGSFLGILVLCVFFWQYIIQRER